MANNQILRDIMNEKRYSGRTLAAAAGMKQATFSSRIVGKTAWKVTECAKIAQILGIKENEIVKVFC